MGGFGQATRSAPSFLQVGWSAAKALRHACGAGLEVVTSSLARQGKALHDT
jgi:hypothetical protein